MHDEGFHVHREFFSNAKKFFRKNGRIYITNANFGNVDEMLDLAMKSGFKFRLIEKYVMPKPDPGVFYAFELTLKK